MPDDPHLPQKHDVPNAVMAICSMVMILPAFTVIYWFIGGASAWWLRSHAYAPWYFNFFIWATGVCFGWLVWVSGVVMMFAFIRMTHRYYR